MRGIFSYFCNDIAYAYHAYLYDFVILMEILVKKKLKFWYCIKKYV